MTGRKELAADTIYGIYPCENSDAPSPDVVLWDLDFLAALREEYTGTIYGNVSYEVAEIIEAEYGIY